MSQRPCISCIKLKEILVCAILVLLSTQTSATTEFPSLRPSSWPTSSPTVLLTNNVSNDPSAGPTDTISGSPSRMPSAVPVSSPSHEPTLQPSLLPTLFPTLEPSFFPSKEPSVSPSNVPTNSPSSEPSSVPSAYPSKEPSLGPTTSKSPSVAPSDHPSLIPSNNPSSVPSNNPSLRPSFVPSTRPTLSSEPSVRPSMTPSISLHPTISPSFSPSTSIVPSNEPSSHPTIRPSSWPTVTASKNPSNVPSVNPTTAPTMFNCTENYDVTGDFYVKELDTDKNCLWVARKDTDIRCQYSSVRNNCPVICGLCPGPPSGVPSPKPSARPSTNPTLSLSPTTAPSLTPTASGMPSTLPSPIPPLPVSTLVDIEFGPVQGEVMDSSEILLFEEIAISWIRPLLISQEPQIQLSDLKVIEQQIIDQTSRRRLVDGSRLVVKLQIEGELIPTNDIRDPGEMNYNEMVKGLFTSKETSETFLKELQTSNNDISTFFSSVAYLVPYSSENKNPISSGPDDDKDKNVISDNDIIIIASAVSGGAIILFGAAMYIYTRKKRNHNNATLESLEQDVELDMDNIFPDIELSNPKKRGGDSSGKEGDWAALQPQRPELNRPLREKTGKQSQSQVQSKPQGQVQSQSQLQTLAPAPAQTQQKSQQSHQKQPIMDSRQKTTANTVAVADDATDGGRSLNTYNTLENFYSGEADNASYQSYGYSLDDGIGSKVSVSPSISNQNSVTEAGPMKMDLYALNSSRYNFIDDDDTLELSVGTPGSIYSGLTTDDASLHVERKRSLGVGGVESKKPAAAAAAPGNNKDDNMSSSSFIRECQAPPGKLGIIIDTTKDGPVVYQVKSGSPLENIIFAGDRIIAIDDIDTRGMTASNVTKIMARKCDEPRKITVSSKTFKGTF
mmetsp:Transcript_11310/g.21166  ORF Transcript_11310/g.21166 Transcript_11310/m.21166 type:complete len:898 (+) Transcript_11310:251-2944(+)